MTGKMEEGGNEGGRRWGELMAWELIGYKEEGLERDLEVYMRR